MDGKMSRSMNLLEKLQSVKCYQKTMRIYNHHDDGEIQGSMKEMDDTIMAMYYNILNEENDHPHNRVSLSDICNLTNDPKLPSIHSLDDDSLYIIFSYLHFMELVELSLTCRRWYNLCTLQVNTATHLKLPPYALVPHYIIHFITVLVRAKETIRSLDLSSYMLSCIDRQYGNGCCCILNVVLHLRLPNLERLNISSLNISEEQSLFLARLIGPNLTHLVWQKFENAEPLENVLQHCKNLEYLDLWNPLCITGDTDIGGQIQYLKGNKIRNLDMSGCSSHRVGLTAPVMRFIFEEFNESLEVLSLPADNLDHFSFETDNFKPLKSLKRLFVINNLIDDEQNYDANTTDFIELLKFMPNLSDLILFHMNYLDWRCTAAVSNIPLYCPLLVHLDISRSNVGSFEHLKFITQLPNLKYLNLSHIGIEYGFTGFLRNTLVNLKQLKTLIIKGNGLSDADVLNIIENHPFLLVINE